MGARRIWRSAEKSLWTMRNLKQHAFKVSQAMRHEVGELGEVGATFLIPWLIAVLLALFALALAWAV